MKRDKKEEFEIQEASIITSNMKNKYPIHPLKKNPTAAIQTMNYKDWLNMCKENSENNLTYLEPFVYSLEGLVAGIVAALGTIVAISNPVSGAFVAITSVLIPLLWPVGNPLWGAIMESTEEIVKKNLTEYARQKALSELAGLKNKLEAFNRAFEYWKENPNTTTANEVKSRFQDANNTFVGAMEGFKLVGFETLLLPVYAQAANLHLLLMKIGLTYAKEWDIARVEGDLYYQEFLLYTAKYSNYCTYQYNIGSNLLFNEGWNIYNNYRTFMTINVLDIISLFPSYDPRMYPISTNIELTREIYSEAIIAFPFEGNPHIPTEVLENSLTRQPHLFTWLQELELFSNKPGDDISALTGHRSVYSHTASDTTLQRLYAGPIYGISTDKNETLIKFNGGYNFRVTTSTAIVRKPIIGAIAFEYTRYYPTNPIPPSSESNVVLVQEFNNENTDPNQTRNVFSFPPITRETVYKDIYNYSHILSYLTSYSEVANDLPDAFTFAWTHNSVSRINAIGSYEGFDIITQIPAIKATEMTDLSVAIKGPGFTGGDLIKLKTYGLLNYSCRTLTSKSMKIRIRYASASSSTSIDVAGNFVQLKKTIDNPDNALIYENFDYAYVPGFVNPGDFYIEHKGTQSSESDLVLLDKIEFIPYNIYTEEIGMENLEKVKKAVNALFTDDLKNDLKVDTTDYEIDQAGNLVECVSDDLYAKEKLMLLDEVKYAKQLSQSRNLLQNGDFESPNGNGYGENGWTTSNNISIQSDNPIFKGNYLRMPGARATAFPTYIYQKVDESKLKPYTRYKARGFVGSSTELELLVTRYDEEVDAIMNVPNDLAYKGSFNSCGGFDRCKSPASQTMDGNMSLMNLMPNNNIQSTSYASPETCHCVPKTTSHKMCHDLHEFSFHIDTGEIDLNKNLGIWMMFKISSPDGYATLDNLEIIEDGPLVGESLAQVKKREKKWKDTMDKKRFETQKAYSEAKVAVDALFTNSQYSALKYETTKANIITADTLVQLIPFVYNEWLPTLPGMNYDIYTELQNLIIKANNLYDLRNFIKNGDFTNGLMHWHATPYAEVQQIDGTSVLVIPNWSATVSQNICLQHNRGYVLRVTGKKEGSGNGYVKICDCTGGIETLTFTSCDHTNGITNEVKDYVTKTIDIFPDTDQVRVEISETEGTFKVESLELICME